MADRYWVGGTGNLDGSTTTHISATSGGAGGATYPTLSDNLIFDINSSAGTYVVTVTGTTTVLSLTTSDPASGTMGLAGSGIFEIYGNITFHANMVRTYTGIIAMKDAVGGAGRNINIQVIMSSIFSFNGTAGTSVWNLTAPLYNLSTFDHLNGTINTNGYYLRLSSYGHVLSTQTKALNLGASLVDITSVTGWLVNNTGFTLSAGTSTIRLTVALNAVNPVFTGGGMTYYNVIFSAAALSVNTTVAFVISGSNTFNILSQGPGTPVKVTDGTTQTIAGYNSMGVAGRLSTISGTSTGGWNLVNPNAGQIISTDYVNISYCTATGGQGFYMGNHSVNGGNNSGLTFTAPIQIDRINGVLATNVNRVNGQ